MHAWFSPQGKRLGFAHKLSDLTSGLALMFLRGRFPLWWSSYNTVQSSFKAEKPGIVVKDLTEVLQQHFSKKLRDFGMTKFPAPIYGVLRVENLSY